MVREEQPEYRKTQKPCFFLPVSVFHMVSEQGSIYNYRKTENRINKLFKNSIFSHRPHRETTNRINKSFCRPEFLSFKDLYIPGCSDFSVQPWLKQFLHHPKTSCIEKQQ